MRSFAQKAPQSTLDTLRRPPVAQHAALSPIQQLQRRVGNRALQRMAQGHAGNAKEDAAPVRDKSANGNRNDDWIQDQKPDAGTGSKAPGAPPPTKKKAGVQSFVVKWTKSPDNGPTALRLRLDYAATFKKDATHDPALAEFRQNAFHKLEVIEGPHKGLKDDNSPLHDDNYSRADDVDGNLLTDTKFAGNDNPGTKDNSLDKDDVVDYSFTAEQMIIDTSDGNKQIAKKGPYTATIKGKHLREVGVLPKTL